MPNYGSYNNGTAVAQNEGVAVPTVNPNLSFGGDMADFMKNALKEQYERKKFEQQRADDERKRAIAEHQRQQAMAEQRAAQDRANANNDLISARAAAQRPSLGNPGIDPIALQLRNLKMGAEADAINETRGRAPIKYIGGPGIIAGPTLDTMSMTNAQRQAYLPQDSRMVADRTAGSDIGSDQWAMMDQRNLARRNGWRG